MKHEGNRTDVRLMPMAFSSVWLYVICLFVIAFLTLIMCAIVRQYKIPIQVSSVRGVVIKVDVTGEYATKAVIKYSPKVCFEYIVNGVTYRNDKVGRVSRCYVSRKDAENICRKFSEGQEVVVTYDVKIPQNSYIQLEEGQK